jgi:hypothetical protein
VAVISAGVGNKKLVLETGQEFLNNWENRNGKPEIRRIKPDKLDNSDGNGGPINKPKFRSRKMGGAVEKVTTFSRPLKTREK